MTRSEARPLDVGSPFDVSRRRDTRARRLGPALSARHATAAGDLVTLSRMFDADRFEAIELFADVAADLWDAIADAARREDLEAADAALYAVEVLTDAALVTIEGLEP